jgi:cytochrome c-type biogenesis protein
MTLSRKKQKKRKRSSVEILGFVAIALFLVGVIWLLAASPSGPNSGQTTTVQTNSPAADFTLNDVNGNMFKLSGNRGKVVVLEFMRTTCEACIEQEPRMRELRSNFGDDVVTVMISVDPAGDTEQLLRQHRDQNMAGWIAIRDTSGIYRQYGVQATPTIFIIDKNGYIAYRDVGVTESSILINQVEGLR